MVPFFIIGVGLAAAFTLFLGAPTPFNKTFTDSFMRTQTKSSMS